MSSSKLNLFERSDPKIRLLHFAWIAFFLTFAIWFNHAALLVHIRESLQLSDQQIKALLILNVALTIPARIVVGMLVDRLGPRLVFASLLATSSVICFFFAMATSFEQLALARFALGFVGAGFVIGIRLVGEWFPARQVGLAEGIYGGWGNFGSAASAMTLPTLALFFGGEDGWRWAVASTGLVSLVYAGIFYRSVRNTPKGSTYFKPKKSGGLEVTSRGDLWFYIAMNLPMYFALALLNWKLSPDNLALLGETTSSLIYLGLAVLMIVQFRQIMIVNEDVLKDEISPLYRYSFRQVAVLDIAYLVTFGSELAVVSMLPLFFLDTFNGLDPVTAGLLASGFAFMNLVARPGGGWLSDRFGRKRTLSITVGCLAIGYLVLGQVDGTWPIALAVAATMACSFFVQAGEGAVFAVVPLVKRRMTGQIAGMVGAYGNVGAVLYLTALSFVDYATFFRIISVSSALALGALMFFEEPEGHTAEIREDGTVELIEVS